MKGIITIALLTLGLSGFAQQRQMVRADKYPTGRYIVQNNRYNAFEFNRLGLNVRQERQLVILLKAKQNEEYAILRKFRNPAPKLRNLDRDYDRKIKNLLSRSQYDKWTKIYAYQYEAYGTANKRWSLFINN